MRTQHLLKHSVIVGWSWLQNRSHARRKVLGKLFGKQMINVQLHIVITEKQCGELLFKGLGAKLQCYRKQCIPTLIFLLFI